MNKQNWKKIASVASIISLWTFVALFTASLVLFVVLGLLALATKIVFVCAIAALGAMVAFNWDAVKSFFKRSVNTTGIYKTVQFLIVIAVLVFLYIVSDFAHFKMDFTTSQLYSLSAQTKDMLKGITNDLKITLFKPGYNVKADLVEYQETLLRTYAEKNPKITFEIIDPTVNPAAAYAYGISDAGTVVFEYNGNRAVVKFDEIHDDNQMTGERRYTGEIAYTSAILGLLDSKAKNIYFLTGHGEINWSNNGLYGFSAMIDQIKKDRMEVYGLNLTKIPVVPTDCGVLVIANPTVPLTTDEMDAVTTYLASGGSVLVLLEYTADITVNDVLRNMSVFCVKNLAVDNESYLPQMGETWVVPTILPFPEITTPLIRGQLSVIMPSPCGLQRLDEGQRPEGYVYFINPLLQTSQYSFGETSDAEIKAGAIKEDDKDLKGPLTLGYAVKRVKITVSTNAFGSVTTNKLESRLVAFGDTDFINNQNYMKYGNTDLLLNSLNFLLRRDADVTTRPRMSGSQPVTLSAAQKRFIFILSIIITAAYLGIGIGIVLNRRKTVKEEGDSGKAKK